MGVRIRVGALAFLVAWGACAGPDTVEQGLGAPRYRAIAGVSMGAIGASRLGTAHPELFDAIGILGGPLIPEYFLYYLENHYLGGFCTPEELAAIQAARPGDPHALENRAHLDCMEAAPARHAAALPERRQRFDRWLFGRNGGTFDRDAYLDLFEDLVLAFGNPLYDTAGVHPPGMIAADLRDPAFCDDPPVFPPIRHPERNPGGRYRSVAFCDGGASVPYCKDTGRAVDRCAAPDPFVACAEEGGVAFAGPGRNEALWAEEGAALQPCAARTRPVGFALAVDVNGNGRRDYGEPVVFSDTFGEGSARMRLLAEDPRRFVDAWDEATRRRMAVYLDAGVRDVFQFDVHAQILFEHLAKTDAAARRYVGLRDFPGPPASEEAFRPLALGARDLPRTMLYLYGDPDAGPEAIAAGDGDHVGTPRQVVNRLLLFLRWLSLRWSNLEDPPADTSSFFSRVRFLQYEAESLGGLERDYAVILPPGYHAPENAKARYPVLFLLHGYGQHAVGPGGFWESFLLVDGYMAAGEIAKMILVFASGRCCQREEVSGEVRCTEEPVAGWDFECHAGSFYARSAATGRDYGGAVLELVQRVDAEFRTLAAPRAK